MTKQEVRKAVMAVIVNDEGKVLIGSSPRDGGFKFPQGGLDNDEHFIDGIIRELKEELAIDITEKDIVKSYTQTVTYIYPDEDRYIFKRQELNIVKIKYNATMKLDPQDDEFEDLVWILPVDLPKYNTYFRAEAYKKALDICGFF
ncbi:NUDIX hydrolase [Aureibaculum sp. 2210JD6-5]|uniref:NUDIX hydrolase n=1 Tax=Aureibaculum sp. 2210JD6-5 TaxID=3103957 RepID=UPI002AAD40D7|nr:NUDIX hydrolase [Aureibaculum sp. 2210JD6-5]MDY7394344.1 NUDIX hydrolase [Aureibaculum sp. 2210JD6-5]